MGDAAREIDIDEPKAAARAIARLLAAAPPARSRRAELLRRWLAAARSRRPGKVRARRAGPARRGRMPAVPCLLGGTEVPGPRRDVNDDAGAATR